MKNPYDTGPRDYFEDGVSPVLRSLLSGGPVADLSDGELQHVLSVAPDFREHAERIYGDCLRERGRRECAGTFSQGPALRSIARGEVAS